MTTPDCDYDTVTLELDFTEQMLPLVGKPGAITLTVAAPNRDLCLRALALICGDHDPLLRAAAVTQLRERVGLDTAKKICASQREVDQAKVARLARHPGPWELSAHHEIMEADGLEHDVHFVLKSPGTFGLAAALDLMLTPESVIELQGNEEGFARVLRQAGVQAS